MAVPDFYREAGDLSYVSQPKVPQENVDRMARDLTEQIAKVRRLIFVAFSAALIVRMPRI